MAIVVEKLVSELKYDVNRAELDKARGSADKLKAATKQLEAEQKKSANTTAKLREDLQDLRVALHKGLISKAEFKKRTTETRLALNDEANAARRAASAIRELRAATAEQAKAARDHEKAESALARTMDRTARRQGAGAGRRGRDGYTVAKGAAANLLSGAVSTAGTALVRGIGDALTGSAAKAVEFESQMADVAKVVDGLKTPTGQATAAYHELSGQLKDLSTQIAVAPEGFAKMAAAAGQAGIKGAELTKFVETAAKVAVAFDITADEAGDGLAKLGANLGITQPQVAELAGTMNHLSNAMASTAPQILDATLRVGSVGKAAGVSGQEVAGLTSAMIAAGATSEIAATATKNFILSMAAGAAATKRQREAFSALGLNAEDVAKQFTGTAEQRIAISRKVIEQMGKLSADKRAATSMQLFGRESLGPIASLTTNVESFDQAMALARDTTAGASSVQKEFDVRSKTTANALQLLKNRVSVVAIEVGEGMMPAINEIVADMGRFLGVTRESGKSIGEVLGDGLRRAWAALRDFLGPADELPGKVERMISTVSDLASALITVVGAVGSVVSTLGGAETALLAVGVAVSGLAGPWGLMAAAATVALAEISSALGKVLREVPLLGDSITSSVDQVAGAVARSRAKDTAAKARDADDDAYARGNSGSMSAGRSAMLGSRLDEAARGAQQPGGRRRPTGAAESVAVAAEVAGMTPEQKMARFRSLAARKKTLRPSEQKELRALSKELDVRIPGGAGGRKAKKDLSAYEQELEGEITRLSKQAGERAGIKAGSEGKSRSEQYAAAKAAEKATTDQLRQRVDAGMTLPGQFHHDMLRRAGFQDVAGRGTPPPIAVSIVKVEAPNIEFAFSGPVPMNPRELADQVTRELRIRLPQALSEGIREARSGVVV